MDDERIIHWQQEQPKQNFGDFLTRLIAAELLGRPKVEADVYRVIGSCIAEWMNWEDLKALGRQDLGLVAYWGCGMRDERPIPPGALRKFAIHGVRGPLSRDVLGLPADTPLVDTGLLTPLFHAPRSRSQTSGSTICVPHVNEPRPWAELIEQSGADHLVSATVDNRIEDLRRIIDDIAGADFVLSGSLHGAIIACAYGVPFCFWETGHVDISFKFRDFAAAIDVPTVFVRNVAEGRVAYRNLIETTLLRPRLLPFLQICPFDIEESAFARAAAHDAIEETLDAELGVGAAASARRSARRRLLAELALPERP